jgi:hypothetical protein
MSQHVSLLPHLAFLPLALIMSARFEERCLCIEGQTDTVCNPETSTGECSSYGLSTLALLGDTSPLSFRLSTKLLWCCFPLMLLGCCVHLEPLAHISTFPSHSVIVPILFSSICFQIHWTRFLSNWRQILVFIQKIVIIKLHISSLPFCSSCKYLQSNMNIRFLRVSV